MANGNFGGGNGTVLNPYLVEDAHDLDAIRNYLGNTSVHFKQVSDIDLSSWGNWEPIQNGTSTSNNNVFRGYYDGGGYKVSNMTCQHDRNHVGLFGYVNSATIRSVFIENCNVSGRGNVGGLVGQCTNSSTISNCYSSGNVSSSINYAGGLIGGSVGSTISNCYSSGNVSSSIDYAGGLVGYIGNTTISNCYSSGSVNGNNYIGGLVGQCTNSSTILNCYSSGDVSGSNYVGGLVGGGHVTTTISNCYALNPFIARVSGSTGSDFSDIIDIGTVENCFSLNTLEFRQL